MLDSSAPSIAKRPGLVHIVFGCAIRSELESWVTKLSELGIAHGGIIDSHYSSG